MSRSRRFSAHIALVAFAAFGLASIDAPLLAQFGGGGGGTSPSVKLKEPSSSRVYQRDVNGKAEIPIVLDESEKDAKVVDARISGSRAANSGIKLVDGKLVGV